MIRGSLDHWRALIRKAPLAIRYWMVEDASLSDVDILIVQLRNGLEGEKVHTLKEVAEQFQRSQEWVRQREIRAYKRIGVNVRRKLSERREAHEAMQR